MTIASDNLSHIPNIRNFEVLLSLKRLTLSKDDGEACF